MTPAVAGIALALAVAACGPERAPWPPAPAAVRLGEHACAACRMIISDERFAAQHHDRSGRVDRFDDLGCLFDAAGGAPIDPQAVFVRGRHGWVRGDRAVVVRAPGIHSPMGYALMAFAEHAAADREASRHRAAETMPLHDLLAHPARRPAAPHLRTMHDLHREDEAK